MKTLHQLSGILGHPFNKTNRIAALWRLFHWQIACRLDSRPRLHQWVNGAQFLARRGEAGITGNIYNGLHEFEDMGFLLHFLRPSDLFVDVGANAGAYTLLACAAIGARARAFEPVPCTYQRLIRNVSVNDVGSRCVATQEAVGAVPGLLRFTSDSDATNHAVAPAEHTSTSLAVSVTTLDLALKNEMPAVIKIDVEGFETAVIAGASETMKKPSMCALLIELNDSGRRYGFDEKELVGMILNSGFTACRYAPFIRRLEPADPATALNRNGNMLLVRDVEYVAERLQSAPPFSVYGQRI
jgi:FkbM family methyltransferase